MTRRRLPNPGLFLGPALAAGIALMPTPEGLTLAGQRGLAVMALCVCWWLLTPVALPVTSLVGLAMLPLLGVMEPQAAMALFGNQAVFFVVGVFLVASATLQTGLSKRLALWTMKRMARSEDSLAAAVLLLSAGLCAVVVSHAVAALMLPIVFTVVGALDLGPRSRTARRLVLSMAWGTILGSNLTLFASARASLSLTTLEAWGNENQVAGASIGFLEFSAATVPLVLLMLGIAFVWLRVVFPPEGLELRPAVDKLDEEVREMGGVSANEWKTVAVIVAMVVALVAWGRTYGVGTVALLFSGALFALKVLEWKAAERFVNWGIVLLYGGAIAIGGALDSSGAMAWLMDQAMPSGGMSPWMAVVLVAGVSMVLTEFVSNAAVIALALPAVLAIAPSVGLDPRAATILMSAATGLAFSMPTSTPAMAMAFGTGYLSPRRVVMTGVPLSLVSLGVLLLVVFTLWPLLGFAV